MIQAIAEIVSAAVLTLVAFLLTPATQRFLTAQTGATRTATARHLTALTIGTVITDLYNGTEGNGAQAGLGVIFDYDGNDVYRGYKQGRASSGISYHDLPQCGGNFGFVIDYGGTDQYGCRARNNSYNQRGSSGGFLIDRPKQEKVQNTAKKPAPQTTVGS